jgi:hypothetical protein
LILGGRTRARTWDPLIKSLPLRQASQWLRCKNGGRPIEVNNLQRNCKSMARRGCALCSGCFRFILKSSPGRTPISEGAPGPLAGGRETRNKLAPQAPLGCSRSRDPRSLANLLPGLGSACCSAKRHSPCSCRRLAAQQKLPRTRNGSLTRRRPTAAQGAPTERLAPNAVGVCAVASNLASEGFLSAGPAHSMGSRLVCNWPEGGC